MLLLRWLQHVLFGHAPALSPAGPGRELPPKPPTADARLLDVVREALREEAEELTDLVARGIPPIRRRRLRERVRRRVQQAIAPEFDSPTVVDEVTERLVHAAEADPYYTRLVGEDETK